MVAKAIAMSNEHSRVAVPERSRRAV